jgi:hypothetical protein
MVREIPRRLKKKRFQLAFFYLAIEKHTLTLAELQTQHEYEKEFIPVCFVCKFPICVLQQVLSSTILLSRDRGATGRAVFLVFARLHDLFHSQHRDTLF